MVNKISQYKKNKSLLKQGFSLVRVFFHKVIFQDNFLKLAQSFHYSFQTPLVQTTRNNQAGN